MSRAPASAICAALKKDYALHVKEQWVQHLLDHAQPPLSPSSPLNEFFRYLLHADFRLIGCASLRFVESDTSSFLKGPIVLQVRQLTFALRRGDVELSIYLFAKTQVNEVSNANAPARHRFEPCEPPNRILVFTLTDGVRELIGVEETPLNVPPKIPPGAKVPWHIDC